MKLSYFRFLLPFTLVLILSPFHLRSGETLLPQKAKQEQVATSPVLVKLLSEEKSIQPARPFWVGVELNMADGWDTYWVNPGDAGFPTKIDWKLPPGFQASSLHWPYPEKIVSQSLVAYGYTHKVLLLTQITPPKNLKAGESIEIGANVSWLACNQECVPGNATLSLNLPITQELPQNAETSTYFSEVREHLPKILSGQGALTIGAKEKEIVLNFIPTAGNFGEIEEALFIPETKEIIDHNAPQELLKQQGSYILNIKRAHPENAPPSHLKGVLLVSEKGADAKKAIQIDTPLETPHAPPAAHHGLNIKIALIFAFLGGLILNVMPCVLPVVALKIFSFVKMSQEKRSTILKHGGVFALGVLVSFWVLSGLLLILRASGQSLGWGFQLQEPVFVVVLTIILFLLALSLFGVFEFGTSLMALGQKTSSSPSSPMKNSFLSGVLATLVATPCTGPLLGPALGFAMTLSAAGALTIFTAMGLGMAAPYLLFSAFPALVRYLPKPGNWMIVFKQLMGFLMMGTCLWLIWVFWAQTGGLSMFMLLGSLLVIAIGAWIYGVWATPIKKKMTRLIATAVALCIFTAGTSAALLSTKGGETHQEQLAQASGKGWQAYSPEKVQELRRQGIPVFVDFTAKWCLICQANKVVLRSSEIQKAFEQHGVVTLSADWTKKDEVITHALTSLGRTGVPVYVLYPANETEAPYILPQTLTSSAIHDYLAKLDSSETVHK